MKSVQKRFGSVYVRSVPQFVCRLSVLSQVLSWWPQVPDEERPVVVSYRVVLLWLQLAPIVSRRPVGADDGAENVLRLRPPDIPKRFVHVRKRYGNMLHHVKGIFKYNVPGSSCVDSFAGRLGVGLHPQQ
jgi:hypothetical protein